MKSSTPVKTPAQVKTPTPATTPAPEKASETPTPPSPPTPRDAEMISPLQSPVPASSSQIKLKDDEGMSEGDDFTTLKSTEEPLSRYRVEGARQASPDERQTIVQLRRRGKVRRCLGVIADHWDHVYVIKGPESKPHNETHWNRVNKQWDRSPKTNNPAQAIREAVQRIRGKPITFVRSKP